MGLKALFMGITLGAATILVLWYHEMQIFFGVRVAVIATLLLYLLVPVLFRFLPSIQRHLVFLPFVRWPSGVNFSDPSSEGLEGGRNLYLEPIPDQTIGVWHFLPRSEIGKSRNKPHSFWDESMRSSGKHIILYMHGNSGSRAGEHRKELYRILQQEDYHVVTFDYRGYADSKQIAPSETSTVQDGLHAYKWIRSTLGTSKTKIFVWGHSLGTGVSSNVVSKLCLAGDHPSALVLESPFTSIGEEVKHHMLAALWRPMPFFDSFFVHPLKANDLGFETDSRIGTIDIPILILHATDDPVVPFALGQKLFDIGLETRSNTARESIYFQGFGDGFAHKFICRSPHLPSLLHGFCKCSVYEDWPCTVLEETKFLILELPVTTD